PQDRRAALTAAPAGLGVGLPGFQLSDDVPEEPDREAGGMRKLFLASFVYLLLGLASGLFYREFTKINDFTAADGFTQLSVVHTHLLTLGVIVLLIVLLLEKTFELS